MNKLIKVILIIVFIVIGLVSLHYFRETGPQAKLIEEQQIIINEVSNWLEENNNQDFYSYSGTVHSAIFEESKTRILSTYSIDFLYSKYSDGYYVHRLVGENDCQKIDSLLMSDVKILEINRRPFGNLELEGCLVRYRENPIGTAYDIKTSEYIEEKWNDWGILIFQHDIVIDNVVEQSFYSAKVKEIGLKDNEELDFCFLNSYKAKIECENVKLSDYKGFKGIENSFYTGSQADKMDMLDINSIDTKLLLGEKPISNKFGDGQDLNVTPESNKKAITNLLVKGKINYTNNVVSLVEKYINYEIFHSGRPTFGEDSHYGYSMARFNSIPQETLDEAILKIGKNKLLESLQKGENLVQQYTDKVEEEKEELQNTLSSVETGRIKIKDVDSYKEKREQIIERTKNIASKANDVLVFIKTQLEKFQ